MRKHYLQDLNKSDISVVAGGKSTENRMDYVKRTIPEFSMPSVKYPRVYQQSLPKFEYKPPIGENDFTKKDVPYGV